MTIALVSMLGLATLAVKLTLYYIEFELDYSLIDQSWHDYLNYPLFAACFALTLLLLIHYSAKRKTKVIFIGSGLFVLLLIVVLHLFSVSFSAFLAGPYRYAYFDSPHGTYKLMLRERDTITSTDINAFQVENAFFIGEGNRQFIGFGEAVSPIKLENFELEWIREDLVKITAYGDGQAHTANFQFEDSKFRSWEWFRDLTERMKR